MLPLHTGPVELHGSGVALPGAEEGESAQRAVLHLGVTSSILARCFAYDRAGQAEEGLRRHGRGPRLGANTGPTACARHVPTAAC